MDNVIAINVMFHLGRKNYKLLRIDNSQSNNLINPRLRNQHYANGGGTGAEEAVTS